MQPGVIKRSVDRQIRRFGNLHVQGRAPNIFILSTPRSGSTWLMETIGAERHMKPCNEPFNIRKPDVAAALGISDWSLLESSDALPSIERYLGDFVAGSPRVAFKNLRPFDRGYRAFSNRIVFKVLHACENRLDWLRQRFDARIVILLRHPAPVSLSRTELPRLRALIDTRLSGPQRESARNVLDSGTPLERAALDWCLQNKPLLDALDQADVIVTYEQLVMEPVVVVDRLVAALDLRSVADVRRAVEQLSRSVAISRHERVQLLHERHRSPRDLVTSWRETVTDEQVRSVGRMLTCFGIDAYAASDPFPSKRLWID